MTTISALNRPTGSSRPLTLEHHLDAARHKIQVSKDELKEARRRRRLLSDALVAEFPGSETYINGSVAHGDALTPLTDVDLGVIVAEAQDTHGPGKKGCSDLEERAAKAMRTALKPEFPDAAVYWQGRKRSVLVRFRKPVDPNEDDFTADVIVAIDNLAGEGLFIPNYLGWDRSHPQKHTEMVEAANESSNSSYARVVRLLKHWNRSNGHPLCSWNIKALALDILIRPSSLLDGMLTWFDHAVESLSAGLTRDPARVAAKPIAVNKNMNRQQVVDQLERALDQLRAAVQLEQDGWPLQAQEQLAKYFNDEDMMPMPEPSVLGDEIDRRLVSPSKAVGETAATIGLGVAAATTSPRPAVPAVRSWNPAG